MSAIRIVAALGPREGSTEARRATLIELTPTRNRRSTMTPPVPACPGTYEELVP